MIKIDNMAKDLNEKLNEDALDLDYLGLLKIRLDQKFPFKTQKEIAEILDIHINTYNSFLNNVRASSKTVETIADYCNVIDYKTYLKRKPIIESIKKRLLSDGGRWISYRLDSGRRLYEAYWIFKIETINGEDTQYLKVVKHHYNLDYSGEAYITPDLTLEIRLRAGENHLVRGETAFLEDFDNMSFYETFNGLVFENTYFEPKEIYASKEIFLKIDSNHQGKSKRIRNTHIPTLPDKNKIPTNFAYLAYNYLTRTGGKTRRKFDNVQVNEVKKNGSILGYEHNIFISCPLSFVRNEETFNNLKKNLESIKETLIDTQGFKSKNIYCELLNYKSFNDVHNASRHFFFSGRYMLDATHYIAILPDELENYSSGVYSEIQFRVLKKLPAMIFLENRLNLPSFLKGIMERPDRPVNISFRDCLVEDIPRYIKESKEHLLRFVL